MRYHLPLFGTAQLLDKTVTGFDERIGRLLAHPQRQKPSERHCVMLPGVSIILVLLVIFGQMMMHPSLLALMQCQPPFFLWKLF